MKLWKILWAVPLCAALALMGCDLEDALDGDDDAGTTDEVTDTGTADDDVDTGTDIDAEDDDDDGDDLPLVYKYVRICSVDEENTGSVNTYGPNIDAVNVVQGEDESFWATGAPNDMQNVTVTEESTYRDVEFALGEADALNASDTNYVSIGLIPGYITLFFEDDIEYDAEIRIYEIGEELSSRGAAANDDMLVQVSLDGENWLNLNNGVAKGGKSSDRVETDDGLGYVPFDSIVDDGDYKQICSTADAE